MTKHSKNNTASSIFSYAEYQKASAEYGTKRQRLGNESMRRFDACSLCLQTAREPVCCKDGHLFCKECAVNDLLSQKKDLKRQKEKAEQIRKEIEAQVEQAKAAARERVLQDFERGQLGLAAPPSSSLPAVPSGESSSAGTKRPFSTAFEFSPSHVSDLVAQAEDAAARAIAKEQAEAAKGVLPDFWLPSLTPTFGGVAARDVLAAGGKSSELKIGAMCRGGGDRHSFALKDLIPVKFSYHVEGKEGAGPKEGKDPGEAVCPSCLKKLSNNVIMFLMKPCSHVICRTCTETLVRPPPAAANPKSAPEASKDNKEEAHVCVVCDTRLKKKDIIELKREGTGFASGGLAESRRGGISFQG
ncbi:hypothetical protein C8F04DRAFT_1261805 [Mycena alexandri]|uniref:RING-type domain-containing protein n=1 Tax=Mycena alexandri TaxID=1745969 RepID=A0AAD6X1Q1_9AGAR|nr:hypothetical protein C8F04DRAFT_1261805 [Mycena alexandri]